MPYAERLKYLNLPSLKLRRVRADMYWCYKIVFGLVDIQPDDFFLLSPVTAVSYTHLTLPTIYSV